MSVYDEMPSPGAGLLRYARLKAGLSQSELAKRAGVARTWCRPLDLFPSVDVEDADLQ